MSTTKGVNDPRRIQAERRKLTRGLTDQTVVNSLNPQKFRSASAEMVRNMSHRAHQLTTTIEKPTNGKLVVARYVSEQISHLCSSCGNMIQRRKKPVTKCVGRRGCGREALIEITSDVKPWPIYLYRAGPMECFKCYRHFYSAGMFMCDNLTHQRREPHCRMCCGSKSVATKTLKYATSGEDLPAVEEDITIARVNARVNWAQLERAVGRHAPGEVQYAPRPGEGRNDGRFITLAAQEPLPAPLDDEFDDFFDDEETDE